MKTLDDPPSMDPINVRDLLIDEAATPALRADALRGLVRRGWPVNAIVAEVPGVSEYEVRRAIEAEDAAA